MQEHFCVGLSQQIYLGLSLDHVDKLIQLQPKDICLIPGIADFWLGVVNYKSSLLWILDTEKFLNISKNNQKIKSQQTALIINYSMVNNKKKLALVIKNLEGVIKVDPDKTESFQSSAYPLLERICDTVARQDEKNIALVKTEILLEELSQQSLLYI